MAQEDERFMRRAIAKAKQGMLEGQSPFGACIAKRGRAVACEHNMVRESCDSTAHAEIHAIRAACRRLKSIDLSGCTIYSTTEPCPMCFAAIHWARISRIVYGASISDAKRAGFNELAIPNAKMRSLAKSRLKIEEGVLAGESRELFRVWKKYGGTPY